MEQPAAELLQFPYVQFGPSSPILDLTGSGFSHFQGKGKRGFVYRLVVNKALRYGTRSQGIQGFQGTNCTLVSDFNEIGQYAAELIIQPILLARIDGNFQTLSSLRRKSDL